jgi:hypothetical protein
VLISPLVFGESKTFTWVPPTEREDGTSLLDSEIEEYYLICNTGFEVIIQNDGNNQWVSGEDDFPPGFHDCWMRAVDTNKLESRDSNVVMFSVRFEVIPTPDKGSGCNG